MEKQNQEPENPEEKFQKKIGKLLAKPKHEFKDEQYEAARSELTQVIDESVEKGFEKAKEIEEIKIGKRKNEADDKDKNKKKQKTKKKGGLWLGADISSSSDTESDSGEGPSTSNKNEDSSSSTEAKSSSSK